MKLKIITHERIIFEGEADEIVIQAQTGQIGVLKDQDKNSPHQFHIVNISARHTTSNSSLTMARCIARSLSGWYIRIRA